MKSIKKGLILIALLLLSCSTCKAGESEQNSQSSSDDSTPYATKMKDSMKDELSKANYKFESDTTIITITQKSGYYLTHVIISSPNQIEFVNYQEQSKQEYLNTASSHSSVKVATAEKILDDKKGIVAINGANFDKDATNLPDMPGHTMDGNPHANILIRNAELYEGSKAKGLEICLHKNGSLSCAYDSQSGESLLSNGVKEIFASGASRLICNTVRPNDPDSPSGTAGAFCKRFKAQVGTDGDGSYNRTIIAMVEPGNYYFVTATTSMTNNQYRQICWDLGCTFAKALDSGGSVSLAFREGGKGNAKKIVGCSRDIPSIVSIREYKDGDPLLGNDATLSTTSNNTNDEDKKEGAKEDGDLLNGYIPEEGDLVGMDGVLDKISDDAEYVELPDGTKISSEEKQTIDRVNDEKTAKKESLFSTIVHLVVMTLGIFILVYIVLLWAFWTFDSVNSIITFSLVSLITFGVYRKSKDMSDTNDKKELTLSRLILVSAIAFFIAWALISGVIYSYYQDIWNKVMNFLGLVKR